MPRDNRCMYMVHVCFMSVVVNVCCVVPLLKIVFFLSCRDVMDVVFSVCIVRREAVGTCVSGV